MGDLVKISESGSEVMDMLFKKDPGSDGRMNWGRNRGARKTNPDSVALVPTSVMGADWASGSRHKGALTDEYISQGQAHRLWMFVLKRQRGTNWRDNTTLQTWVPKSLV